MQGHLEKSIAQNEFVITAEIVPPVTVDRGVIEGEVACLKGRVHGVNVTDSAAARATLSSLGACAVLADLGLDPIVQMTCRDRNRIALASDLLTASLFGIKNVLTLTGDDPSQGDQPEAKGVFDLSSSELLSMAKHMRDEQCLPSGREINPPPHFFLGATAVPVDPDPDWSPATLLTKASLGAQFVQTQFCYDPKLTARFMARLHQEGLTEKLKFILGVGPILSAKSARWMNDNLFGVTVPDEVIARLENSDDPRSEGDQICAELIQTYRQMEGVAGVHIMAPAQKCAAIGRVLDLL